MKFNIYDNLVFPIRSLIVRLLKQRQRRKMQKHWRKTFRKNTQYKLSKQERHEVREFYKPFCNISPVFHAFYKEKTGSFFAEYIPDDLYYNYIDQFYNNWDTAPIIDNKCFYDKIFPNVLQPVTVLKRINNIWFNREQKIVTSEIAFDTIISNELFAKYATFSEGGHGVFFIDCKEKAETFWEEIKNTKRDIVLQLPICQHDKLARINRSSVNTIRVLSLLTDDNVKIYSCILRMGTGGSKVDNASSGGITCGISEDGRLKKTAYKSSGKKFTVHPDSKIDFENYELPSFNRILEMVKELQLCVPMYRLVSWDFAVRDDGEPLLIEANLRYGELDFHQLNNGPVFGKDTRKILEEVFNTQKKLITENE